MFSLRNELEGAALSDIEMEGRARKLDVDVLELALRLRERAEEDERHDVEDEDDEDDEPLGSAQETQWVTATTRAGRVSRLPTRYRQEINAAALNTQAGRNFYELLIEEDEDDDEEGELACVGARLGGGFENTNELHAMNYKAAMKTPDKKKWEKRQDGEDGCVGSHKSH